MSENPPTTPTSALWLATWTVSWLSAFGVYELALVPMGYGMFGQSWVSGCYWLLATALALTLFRAQLNAPEDISWPALLTTATVLTAILGTCLALRATTEIPKETLKLYESKQIGIVLMDANYFGVKVPEILFQQSMIALLVCYLGERRQGWALIGTFALFFGSIHLPIVFLKGLAGFAYVAAAYSASLIFPPLIAFLRWGVCYSFCVHLSAYAVTGVIMRLAGDAG